MICICGRCNLEFMNMKRQVLRQVLLTSFAPQGFLAALLLFVHGAHFKIDSTMRPL
jgi:hypothetical protein